ncbi:amino acid adenylation domain-containing protein [Leptobacterium flavescens]|uniref:Amino acid adenylation domain-containing protein n=1 Tax=Leptobacterium flavescens TaxID=472055 RepID=A0A6P0UTD5_9FLAO|nr:amino acid adenylation domain-containing protein [Leptobacterium flavescens]NER13676.1 amino acid adenylation domain-containing protein [Leptobacterium flavescens]
MIYNLPQILERSAKLYPEKTAYSFVTGSLSYSELNEKAAQLSAFLLRQGVRKGDRVGIYMNRCLETAIAVYGIMGSGAVYVPLDPAAPAARTRFLLKDCDIRHLISIPGQSRALINLLSEETGLVSVIGLKQEMAVRTFSWEDVFRDRTPFKRPEILGKDLAYIMYTSGSTGAPKGIMHTHNSGLAYAKLSAELYDLNEKDVVGSHAPLHFDISTFAYFSAPLAGASTIIVSDAHIKLPASLSQLMEKEKISVWYSVPLALIQLLQRGVLEKRDLSSLRWVLFGGEVFISKYLLALMKMWPHARFSNVYGPAEVNQCTFYHLENPPSINEEIPIGEIWNNTEARILDANDKEVKKGETGVLAIRSETMMLGYWNNPELTERSLFREKTTEGFESVYFKTGDMVRKNEKGELMFAGRNDRQVKIRGYRVELDEIEALLNAHENIEASAAFTTESDNDGKEITAVALTDNEKKYDSTAIRVYCEDHLPAYAIPTNIYVFEEFPRTSSGKIDRIKLKETITEKRYE